MIIYSEAVNFASDGNMEWSRVVTGKDVSIYIQKVSAVRALLATELINYVNYVTSLKQTHPNIYLLVVKL